jgi:hypothetical protein
MARKSHRWACVPAWLVGGGVYGIQQLGHLMQAKMGDTERQALTLSHSHSSKVLSSISGHAPRRSPTPNSAPRRESHARMAVPGV